MTRFASSTGQSETLRQELESRLKVCESPECIEVIQGQLATADKDWPRVESCVAQLLTRADLKALIPSSSVSNRNMATLNKVTPLWAVLKPLENVAEAEKVYSATMCELLDAATRDQSLYYLVLQPDW